MCTNSTLLNLAKGLAAVSGGTWHRRFGHLNLKDLNKMKNGLFDCLDCKDIIIQGGFYKVCCEGRQTRLPFGKGSRATSALDVIHADLCGPMEVNALGGISCSYLMILQECSLYTFSKAKIRLTKIYFI